MENTMILPLPGQLDLPACEHEPSKLLLQRFSDDAAQIDLETLIRKAKP
jgi:hypothetical protein